MGRRLFVSADMSELETEIAAVQEHFAGASGLRLTDPAQAHVTLKFLGDTDEDRIPAVCDRLEEAIEESGVEPFTAKLGGLGAFPSTEYISVVWLGVRSGGERLGRLHEAVEAATVEMGFEPEDHEFTPHVTLARMDHAGGKERVQRVLREEDPDAGQTRVEAVNLTESTLTEDGPEYRTVRSVGL